MVVKLGKEVGYDEFLQAVDDSLSDVAAGEIVVLETGAKAMLRPTHRR